MPLRLRTPALADMSHRAAWMADPATMAYNAGLPPAPGYDAATGCLAFPVAHHDPWLRAWTASPDRFAAMLADDDVAPALGEVAFRVTPDGVAHLHLLVAAAHRGRGIGDAGLALLVAAAFARPDVSVAADEFPADREGAEALFRRAGFVRDGDRVVLTRHARDAREQGVRVADEPGG